MTIRRNVYFFSSLQKPESKRNQGSTCRDAETRVELIPSCNETQLNSVKVLTLFKSDCDACNHQSLLVHQVFGPKEGIINSALVHNRRAQKDYVKAIESTFNVLQWDFAIIKDYLTNTEEQNLQKSVETRIFNFNETYISLSKNLQEEISKIKQLKSHSYDQIADAIASETISGNENTSEQFTCYLQDKYKLLKEDEVYSSFNKLLE